MIMKSYLFSKSYKLSGSFIKSELPNGHVQLTCNVKWNWFLLPWFVLVYPAAILRPLEAIKHVRGMVNQGK